MVLSPCGDCGPVTRLFAVSYRHPKIIVQNLIILWTRNPEILYKYRMPKRIPLRIRRAALEMNQFAVADAAEIGRDRYVRIELGYADPSKDEQKAIARALKAKRDDLFPELTVNA